MADTQAWPTVVLAGVVGLCCAAVVFLFLLRLRAGEWNFDSPLGRGLVGMGISLAFIAGLAFYSAATGARFDRVGYTGLGAFLAGCTLLRPRWFWEHGKARAVRALLGDGGTMAAYLALAATLLYVGLFTNMPFGRHR